MKKFSNALNVKVCDANEDELCTEVGFIKNKNKHIGCCYCRWVRFTDKLIKKI